MLFKPEYVEPILSGEKTNTRLMRKQWKVGSFQQCRVNYQTEPFAYVYITGWILEKWDDLTEEYLAKQGIESKQQYLDTYTRFFPEYYGELHLYTFVVVTKEEYEQKRRVFFHPEVGDKVKVKCDIQVPGMPTAYRLFNGNDETATYKVTQIKNLMHGVRVAWLEGVSGCFNINFLEGQYHKFTDDETPLAKHLMDEFTAKLNDPNDSTLRDAVKKGLSERKL